MRKQFIINESVSLVCIKFMFLLSVQINYLQMLRYESRSRSSPMACEASENEEKNHDEPLIILYNKRNLMVIINRIIRSYHRHCDQGA